MEQEMITLEVALQALFFFLIIAPTFIASLICVDKFLTKVEKEVKSKASYTNSKNLRNRKF